MNRDLAEIDHRSRTYSLTNGRIMADFVLGRQGITRDQVEVWTRGSGGARSRGRLLLQPQPVPLPRGEVLNRVIAGAGTGTKPNRLPESEGEYELGRRVPLAGPSRISHGERRSPALSTDQC